MMLNSGLQARHAVLVARRNGLHGGASRPLRSWSRAASSATAASSVVSFGRDSARGHPGGPGRSLSTSLRPNHAGCTASWHPHGGVSTVALGTASRLTSAANPCGVRAVSSSTVVAAQRPSAKTPGCASPGAEMTAHVERIETLGGSAFLSASRWPERPLFGTKGSAGEWEWVTYGQFYDRVQQVAASLIASGVSKGDRVAIISRNSSDWASVAYGAYTIGAVVVPMYEAQKPSEWSYVISDSEPSIVFVSTPKIKAQVQESAHDNVVCFKDDSMSEFLARGATDGLGTNYPKPDPHDLATIIYTSGTTGNPKGVELSHDNICSNMQGLHVMFGHLFPSEEVQRSLALLPWAHVMGQTLDLHFMMSAGVSVAFAESPEKLASNLVEIRPTHLVCVPLVLYRVYDAVLDNVNRSGPIASAVFQLALKIATWHRQAINAPARAADVESLHSSPPCGDPGFLLRTAYGLADRIVYSKIKGRLGGGIKMIIAGGAATSKEVQNFFSDIGMPVIEGYGATETSPIVAVEYVAPTERLQGGLHTFYGTDLVIISPEGDLLLPDGETEGELCVSGRQVMVGYHNLPEATAEAFWEHPDTGARYFRTGDRALLRPDGRLRITGRMKEQFKLATGKFVSPAGVEDAMKTSGLIGQAFVTGRDLQHTVALVVPDAGSLASWEKDHSTRVVVDEETNTLPKRSNQKLYESMTHEISLACSRDEHVKHYEVPGEFVILHKPFSVEDGELTQKLSMKRAVIEDRYKVTLDDMRLRASK